MENDPQDDKGLRGEKFGEVRCECGKLLAKINKDGLEIKCKRCKRFHTIPASIRKNPQKSGELQNAFGVLDERCECHHKLAELVMGGVEIKCNGCKRIKKIRINIASDYLEKRLRQA